MACPYEACSPSVRRYLPPTGLPLSRVNSKVISRVSPCHAKHGLLEIIALRFFEHGALPSYRGALSSGPNRGRIRLVAHTSVARLNKVLASVQWTGRNRQWHVRIPLGLSDGI